MTFATRGLSALAIPSYLVALLVGIGHRARGQRAEYVTALTSGLGVSLLAFFILWYQPNHAEISRVNGYYIGELLLPHSIGRLTSNILTGLFDYQRGTIPYLFRHTPVQFSLACAGIGWVLATRGGVRLTSQPDGEGVSECDRRPVILLLTAWTATYLVFLCCVNYAPSRYNVLFYPAMAALSAFVMVEISSIASEIFDRRLSFSLIGSLLICLAGQAFRSRLVLIDTKGMLALFCGIAIALYVGTRLGHRRYRSVRKRYFGPSQSPEVWVSFLAIWAIVNLYWTGDWLLHLTFHQRAADRWLAANLEPNSTLIGAAAPGLCLNNRFRAVNVIANLSNDGAIVEQCAPPRYIVMLDGGNWRERWWDERYPQLTVPSRRVRTFDNLLRSFYSISIYSVDTLGARKPPPLYIKR